MNRFWAHFSIFSLALLASLTLACGSGRHLQSISIAQTVNGSQIQFVATGTFSAAPKTVTPVPVMWGVQLYAPPPRNLDYTLSTQPYVLNCGAVGSQAGPVSAVAPPDPGAPTSGSWTFSNMILAYATVQCP